MSVEHRGPLLFAADGRRYRVLAGRNWHAPSSYTWTPGVWFYVPAASRVTQ